MGATIESVPTEFIVQSTIIFAVIAEELGLVGAVVVILLFAFFIIRMLRIGRLALQVGLRAA